MRILIEIIGWAAAVMMLSAYVLLTTGRFSSTSPMYQWLNVLSGAGFIVNSGWNGAYPSAFINVMWMGIGLMELPAVLESGRSQRLDARRPSATRGPDRPPLALRAPA